MEKIQDTDTLDEYRKKMLVNRRAYTMARATMKRAKVADIPDQYTRIGKDKFIKLLDTSYHQDDSIEATPLSAKELADYIYDSPGEVLRKYPFIVIDGSFVTNIARKIAGFALLFRFISLDRNGKYVTCENLVHKVQSLYSSEGFVGHRNDICEEHKGYDVLFLSECKKDLFKPGWESGMFVNEILESREDNLKTTIVSFSEQLSSLDSSNGFNTTDYGTTMVRLNQIGMRPISNVLRIRVKDMREWK